jgi:hypothetical protein
MKTTTLKLLVALAVLAALAAVGAGWKWVPGPIPSAPTVHAAGAAAVADGSAESQPDGWTWDG